MKRNLILSLASLIFCVQIFANKPLTPSVVGRGAAAAGWTSYPPLSGLPQNPGVGNAVGKATHDRTEKGRLLRVLFEIRKSQRNVAHLSRPIRRQDSDNRRTVIHDLDHETMRSGESVECDRTTVGKFSEQFLFNRRDSA